MSEEIRAGEVRLPFDPADRAAVGVTFIGTLHTDWAEGDAPRNLRQSRERGGGNGRVVLRPEYRAGLTGLAVGQAIWLVLWFDRKRRDLIVQAPGHTDGPRGAFALRSPVRPNPVVFEAVRITELDATEGTFTIDVTDALDGTPVIDIKPWLETVDMPG